MTDYVAPTSGGEGGWSGASGTAGTPNFAAASEQAIVVWPGFNFNSDTITITLETNAPDDQVEVSAGGADDDTCIILSWVSATTGSAIDLEWSGMDAGDSGVWFAFGVENSDTTEMAATGFSATDTGVNENTFTGSVATDTDDLVITGSLAFRDGIGTGDLYTPGSGETEIAERYDSTNDQSGYAGYEKATGTPTACTADAADAQHDTDVFIAAVIPTAAAGGLSIPVAMNSYRQLHQG